jgi:formylmethanofuran:tetrahydromethanopterin formyltransferase
VLVTVIVLPSGRGVDVIVSEGSVVDGRVGVTVRISVAKSTVGVEVKAGVQAANSMQIDMVRK